MFKNIIRYLLIILVIFSSVNPALCAAHEDVQRVFIDAVRDFNIPGAVMIIETPGGERWTLNTGVRRVGSMRPVTSRHRFRVGSITKTFVSSILLMLVSEGRVALDTRVHDILPEKISSDDPVTVRHLLQMRSNLGNFATDNDFLVEFRSKPWKKWAPSRLLEYRELPPGPSGAFFEYSNSNYVLLGMIIERLTKDTFENQVHRRILKPLKLKSTYFPTSSTDLKPPFARGHDYNPNTGKVNDLSFKINPSWAWCSGNAVSNARDIMDWIIAYLNGYGIDKELLEEQFEFKPALHYGVSYGLGVMNKSDAVGHNGNFAGIYTSLAFRYRGFYFVILTNGQSRGGGQNSTAESVFWRVVNNSGLFEKWKADHNSTESVAKN